MKSFTADFYEEGKFVGQCTAEAADWKAGWLGVVKAANDRELSFDRVDMATVCDVNIFRSRLCRPASRPV